MGRILSWFGGAVAGAGAAATVISVVGTIFLGTTGLAAAIAAMPAVVVGVVFTGFIVAGAVIGNWIYDKVQKQQELSDFNNDKMNEVAQNQAEAEQNIADLLDEIPSGDDLVEQAKENAGVAGTQELSQAEAEKFKDKANNNGSNFAIQPVSANEVQDAATQAANAQVADNQKQFEALIAELQNNRNTIEDLQAANKIENPITATQDTTDTKEEETNENLERMKEELTFEKEDFDELDGYEFMIDNVMVKLYIKSDIELISDDEDFQSTSSIDLKTGIYTDAKGQEHAVSSAYDEDGNPLDTILMSTQTGYLEYGLSGSYGFVKLIGTGNMDNYSVEGYGSNVFAAGAKEYEAYFKGDYSLTNTEKEKESLLGTNSTIISKKEYKFRDSGSIELSEADSSSVPDAYRAAIFWACDVMREVNLQSYTLDLGDAELIIGQTSSVVSKGTFEEDGVTYTYDENATITLKTNGATYSVKSVLENKMATMEELIDGGFEPLTVNGKTFESKEDVDDAKTDAKASFTIVIDEPTETEKFEREVFYTDEDGMKYYFTTKCSSRYHVVLEDGTSYTLQEALEVYTIKELMDNGLDCKSSIV